MEHADLTSRPSMYRALTLSERASHLRECPAGDDAPFDAERARRRLSSWRRLPAFKDPDRFAARVAGEGLGEAELLRLLGERGEAVSRRAPAVPAWLRDLDAALSDHASGAPVSVPDTASSFAMAAALPAIAPLVRQGRARLQAEVERIAARHANPPFSAKTVVDVLYASLAPSLVSMVGRVMALEVNAARIRGALPAGTPEERFATFFEGLARPRALAELFDEYPVLGRRLVQHIDAWVRTNAEFLERLSADWPSLREVLFDGRDPGPLVRLDGSMGDTHRGGRSVRIAWFESGQRAVYKPRSLAVDVHFQELCAWLDDRGHAPPFRRLRIVDRAEHGWVECVEPRGCSSRDEVRRFYERQGASLAVLYALDAADFHSENILASGEHPVLIDLEALFHPRFAAGAPGDSAAAAGAELDASVLRIGLLPHRVQGGNGVRGLEISGLGGGAGQLTPFQVPYWEKRGTDEIRLGSKSVEVPVADNLPSLDGVAMDSLAHTDEIALGFERAYRILLANRAELLSATGPLARFAEDEIRVILRPTAGYDELLTLSHHPDVLRDALDRDRYFDRLRVGMDSFPHAERVVAAELADLHAGDIPFFTTRPGSRDLFTSRGERVEGFLAEPSAEQVARRVAALSEADLAKQLRYIRSSLATLQVGRDRPARAARPLPSPRVPTPEESLSDRLLGAARAVGDELARTAIHAGEQSTWVGMTLVEDRDWSLAPLDADLYTGLPGVALFLAALGAATNDNSYSKLARRAARALVARADATGDRLAGIGAFSGWGGVVYGLSRLGALLRDQEPLDAAARYARRIPALVAGDTALDLVNGSAGCALALLSLHHEAPSPDLLSAATLCGAHLLDTARPMERGIAWPGTLAAQRPLCGLSHGASGMALALSALGAETGEPRFLAAARGAVEYEAGLFSSERANWPDFRLDDTPGAPVVETVEYMTAWCHGAPGIGLARLAMRGHLGEASLRADIDAAIATTESQGFGRSHSLCHGDAGNLEFLSEASRALGDSALRLRVQGAAAALVDSIERDGWSCGILPGVETPGLMMGISGIGLALLRIARPEIVPSVLTLASDPARLSKGA